MGWGEGNTLLVADVAQTAINPGVFLGLAPCAINGVNYATCSTNANLNQRRRLGLENAKEGALIGALDLHDDVGYQTYHGLRLTMTRRAGRGVSITGNYTISKCIGTATPGSFPQISAGYTNPDNPSMDKGHCDQDRHQRAHPVDVD